MFLHAKRKKTMATKLIPLSALFLCLPFVVLATTCSINSVVEEPYTSVSRGFAASKTTLNTFTIFPAPSLGPESLVFELTGEGPYTGISDGRILKYEGPEVGFVDFAYASPNRTKAVCDGTEDPQHGRTCGRPLGLGFNHRTNELYIADAYFGLCKVGTKGGLAEQLATVAEDVPLKWLDGIDVDQRTEIVYFTDVSTVFCMSEIEEHLATGDSTGRLLSYDPKTKEVKVLMRDLQGAGGVVVSKDSSFVLVSEFAGNRIQKYWLTGPKAGQGELFMSIPGPANMKRTLKGDFWVSSVLQLQEPAPLAIPRGVRISESGAVLEILTLGGIFNNTIINEVQEHGGSYYIGSIFVNFAAAAKI